MRIVPSAPRFASPSSQPWEEGQGGEYPSITGLAQHGLCGAKRHPDASFMGRTRGGKRYNFRMARFLHRVRLENYKSIAHCDVELKDLTFLVGPNGAGKSNFLSSLYFLFLFPDLNPNSTIEWESIAKRHSERTEIFFMTEYGDISTTKNTIDNVQNSYSNLETEALLKFRIINFSLKTDEFKEPKPSKKFRFLKTNGGNIVNILYAMQNENKTNFNKVKSYLKNIAPCIHDLSIIQAGGYDILQFHEIDNDVPFNGSQVSDGTLHALGVLTALFHAKSANASLITIEEPEAGLHPAAARVLREALMEASEEVQIIVTSHSPDLLDSPDIDPDSILAVVRENGETKIGPIDAASRKNLSEHLFTAGELLRMNQLEPAA
ncbi:AAA family ATPase [Armatimonas sp.]|uniref:AAA family ATPase n=1 Tax=Armatimonas sp. TaxID=1872638 RepID=UPI00374FDE4D